MTLGIKHTGVFWKIDFQCCPTDQFLVFYILFYFPRLIKMRVCVYVFILCLHLHICTLNNNHLISLRNSCSLDTSCGMSDTLFLEYNADVNAR